jgi:hypothetical protein
MMHCETGREQVILMLCGELGDSERLGLEAHLATCPACASILEEERGLLSLVGGVPDEGPPAALLRRCRDDLHRTLQMEPEAGRTRRTWRLRLSPAWALALVVAAFVAGRAFQSRDTSPENASTIANVDFHEGDPLSDRVSLTYDTLRRTSLSGTASDPRIRRVLVDTVRDNRNAGLRLEALEALRRHADDREVRTALLRAVREDDNAGARLKALEALRGRAADDPEVRDAIVQALLKDTNPGVRVRAIDALQGTRGPETLAVLRRLADEDPNEYVRLRSAALVSDVQRQETVR